MRHLRHRLRSLVVTIVMASVALAAGQVTASAQLPLPPLPIPPPALPVPVPAPAPALPVPAPPPVQAPSVDAPAVPVPTAAPATAAPAVSAPLSAPQGALPASGSSASSSSSSSASSGWYASSPEGTADTQPGSSKRVQVRQVRDQRSRPGVELRFSLPRARTVLIVFRGPVPACDRAGRLVLRGRRGVNEFRFFGQIRGRQLEQGTYVLTIQAGTSPPRRVAVSVLDNGAQALSRPEVSAAIATCTTAPALALARAARLSGPAADDGTTAIPPAPASKPKPSAAQAPEAEPPFRVVLPEIGSLSPGDGVVPLAIGLVVLGLLGLAGVAMAVFLVRFFRPGSEL